MRTFVSIATATSSCSSKIWLPVGRYTFETRPAMPRRPTTRHPLKTPPTRAGRPANPTTEAALPRGDPKEMDGASANRCGNPSTARRSTSSSRISRHATSSNARERRTGCAWGCSGTGWFFGIDSDGAVESLRGLRENRYGRSVHRPGGRVAHRCEPGVRRRRFRIDGGGGPSPYRKDQSGRGGGSAGRSRFRVSEHGGGAFERRRGRFGRRPVQESGRRSGRERSQPGTWARPLRVPRLSG